MEIMLQLRCVLVSQFTVSFLRQNYIINDSLKMTLELSLFVVRLYYVWKQRYNDVLFLFVIVTYFLLRHDYFTYLFDELRFLMTLELRFILVRSNYVQKLRYKMVIF